MMCSDLRQHTTRLSPPLANKATRHGSLLTHPPIHPPPISDEDAASGKGILYVAKEYLELPFRLACAYTIPDLSIGARSANSLWILASVAVSLLWLCIYVFFMLEWVERIGCQIGISAGVMGLTLSAVGTSVPDAYMSFLVAKVGPRRAGEEERNGGHGAQ